MKVIMSLFLSIVGTPAILVSLLALCGLLLQKKKTSDVISGTVKTMIGFLVLTGGAGVLSGALTPFASMFQR